MFVQCFNEYFEDKLSWNIWIQFDARLDINFSSLDKKSYSNIWPKKRHFLCEFDHHEFISDEDVWYTPKKSMRRTWKWGEGSTHFFWNDVEEMISCIVSKACDPISTLTSFQKQCMLPSPHFKLLLMRYLDSYLTSSSDLNSCWSNSQKVTHFVISDE